MYATLSSSCRKTRVLKVFSKLFIFILTILDTLTMELAEDFAGVNWKSLYLELAFHNRMLNYYSFVNSSEIFKCLFTFCIGVVRVK